MGKAKRSQKETRGGARPGAGRPSRLTPEVQSKICQALRAGNFRKVASEYAGIPYRVFAHWMQLGREETSGPHFDFCRAVIEAEKQAEIRAVTLVMKAAENDPRHAEWWLSHRFPDRWADQQRRMVRAELTGKNRGPIETMELSADGLSREDVGALGDILARARKGK